MLLSTPHGENESISLDITALNVAGSNISLADSIKTLGVTVDSNLTFKNHVESICQSGYYHLKALKHIMKYINENDANTLACAFVHARLDYANSLL